MNMITILILLSVIAVISSLVTNIVRRYSISRELLDVPNHRSSHEMPTPKGGGISIVLILFLTILILFLSKKIDSDISISMLVGLSIVSLMGLLDDYKNLSILKRAIAYVFGAIISVYIIGGIAEVSVNNLQFQVTSLGGPLAVLFIVWMTNLYNFMDGTDGFAAVQTICISLFSGALLYLSSHYSFSIILFSLVAATLGFLYWNWPPAKIFMGDVGSCTIGFLLGLFSIYTEKTGIISISVWLILFAPFFADATYTLLNRIANKEKWYKAHNSHAYQKLYQLGMSHRKLAICLIATNVLLIWPLAYFAHFYKNTEFVMLLSAYCIIGIIWLTVQIKHQRIKSITS